jgi:hypothetical protein
MKLRAAEARRTAIEAAYRMNRAHTERIEREGRRILCSIEREILSCSLVGSRAHTEQIDGRYAADPVAIARYLSPILRELGYVTSWWASEPSVRLLISW